MNAEVLGALLAAATITIPVSGALLLDLATKRLAQQQLRQRDQRLRLRLVDSNARIDQIFRIAEDGMRHMGKGEATQSAWQSWIDP